jgi:outer membrane lipoprotein-sorting protein
MRKTYWRSAVVALLAVALTGRAAAEAALTAEQIVEKNVAARGGLEAWRKIETMAWLGRVETPSVPGGSMPFILEFRRPNKTRFSVDPQGQPGMRIFDGSNGWKVRPTRDGSPDVQPYTAEELKAAGDGAGLDGPLIDYRAKGIDIALEGQESVDGQPAYRLLVKLPSGSRQHVWVDAQTFLDVRADREAVDKQGRPGIVWTAYRNYQTVGGLQVPMTIERSAAAGKVTDRMVIDRVVLNPDIDAQAFAKPNVPVARRKVLIDTRQPPPGATQPGAPAPSGATGTAR